jgi:16S rRNA (guanine1207-N2)-methyltransferase
MMDLSQLKLSRKPGIEAPNLRAWDTADQYLLNRIDELGGVQEGMKIRVVNDAFGALCTALTLKGASVSHCTDSWTSILAMGANLRANGLDLGTVGVLPADVTSHEFDPDLVVTKIPRNLAFWEDGLLRLHRELRPGVKVLAGSMIKHTSLRAYSILEQCIGKPKTSLGWKKARLAEAVFHPDVVCHESLEPVQYRLEDFDLSLMNGPNLFSREKLDLGTRFLLEHLPELEGNEHVVDLGCGNGVLALALKRRHPGITILGVDDSFQAISSCLDNARNNQLDGEFLVRNDLSGLERESQDLVISNPPFHQDQVVGDGLARRMFQDAHDVLKAGGEFRLVGNRHLGYHARLTEIFADCALVAENEKFVILSAIRT